MNDTLLKRYDAQAVATTLELQSKLRKAQDEAAECRLQLEQAERRVAFYLRVIAATAANQEN